MTMRDSAAARARSAVATIRADAVSGGADDPAAPTHIDGVELSQSARRALFGIRPTWRGRMHKWAFFISIPAGIALVLLASTARERLGAGLFAFGATFMFGASMIVHWKRWTAPQYERLFRLDHTGIFIKIAAGTSPVALIGMSGGSADFLFWAAWGLAIFGIFQEWLPFHPPRGLVNALFLVIGWIPILVLPAMWSQLPRSVFLLILVQGVLYTGGAFVVGLQKPNPWPSTFGYHEIWHVCVTVAVVVHYIVVLILLGRI